MNRTSEKILDIAERRLRAGGYRSVSYRDLAAALGVKAASIHYHFPRKELLVAAAVDRYADRFFDRVNRSGAAPLAAFCAAYAGGMIEDGPCLCGVLGAEIDALPDHVAVRVRGFFADNIGWLEHHMDDPDRAAAALAALQGGMMAARAMKEPRLFAAAMTTLRAA